MLNHYIIITKEPIYHPIQKTEKKRNGKIESKSTFKIPTKVKPITNYERVSMYIIILSYGVKSKSLHILITL